MDGVVAANCVRNKLNNSVAGYNVCTLFTCMNMTEIMIVKQLMPITQCLNWCLLYLWPKLCKNLQWNYSLIPQACVLQTANILYSHEYSKYSRVWRLSWVSAFTESPSIYQHHLFKPPLLFQLEPPHSEPSFPTVLLHHMQLKGRDHWDISV